MQATFSKEYYIKYWDRFLEYTPDPNYFNLEDSMERAMRVYHEVGVPEDKMEPFIKMEAEKIRNYAYSICKKMQKTLEEVNAGKASFGFTTKTQEIRERADYTKRFEFNCLQLAVFCEKYGINKQP